MAERQQSRTSDPKKDLASQKEGAEMAAPEGLQRFLATQSETSKKELAYHKWQKSFEKRPPIWPCMTFQERAEWSLKYFDSETQDLITPVTEWKPTSNRSRSSTGDTIEDPSMMDDEERGMALLEQYGSIGKIPSILDRQVARRALEAEQARSGAEQSRGESTFQGKYFGPLLVWVRKEGDDTMWERGTIKRGDERPKGSGKFVYRVNIPFKEEPRVVKEEDMRLLDIKLDPMGPETKEDKEAAWFKRRQ